MEYKNYKIFADFSPITVYEYETTDSTNTRARELAKNGIKKAAVIAEGQTAGRGRLGRSFKSDTGLGLYMSLVVYPKNTRSALTLTALMGVAVCRAIKRETGIQAKIKWINDIILGEKKLAGILAEGEFDEAGNLKYSIIGVGINLIPRDFSELSEIATSLGEYCTPPDAKKLARAVICEFYRICRKKNYKKELSYYRENSTVIGNEVNVIKANETYRAHAVGIADDFSLIAKRDGITELISSCEVSIRKPTN